MDPSKPSLKLRRVHKNFESMPARETDTCPEVHPFCRGVNCLDLYVGYRRKILFLRFTFDHVQARFNFVVSALSSHVELRVLTLTNYRCTSSSE